jgi:hypothetical protein
MTLQEPVTYGSIPTGAAIDALEAMMNILFPAQSTDDWAEVRKLLRDTEPCTLKLAQFLKELKGKESIAKP